MSAHTMPQSVTPVTGYEVDTTSTTTDTLLARVSVDPSATLLARPAGDGWEDVSAQEFLDDVRAVAKGLVASGVEVGQRVGLFGQTAYEWTLADYAIWFAGGISVPFYDTASHDQLTWMIEDAGVDRGFVQSSAHADRVRAAVGGSPVTIWVYEESGLDDLRAAGSGISDAQLEARRAAVTSDSVATLIYTSGTTGKSKGCVITHANFVQTAQAAQVQIPEVVRPGARCLLFIPLAHVFARFIQVLAISSGVVLAHNSDLTKLTDSLASFKPTFILGVPRVFEKVFNAALAKAESGGRGGIFRRAEAVAVAYSRALDEGRVPMGIRLQHAVFDRLVYSKLRAVMGGDVGHAVSGGGPLGEHLGHFYRGIGLVVLEGYGLTETTAPITVNVPSKAKIGTVGVPLPGCAVAIAPDGEVLAKGVSVFREYWKNEKATAETFVDGWFATGDIGELDEDGYLRITGRKKELIVTSSGKNVAPAPLEDSLRRHPIIAQPVVLGDNRNFISALIFLDPEMLPGWLENKGLPAMTLKEAASDERVRDAVARAVERTNSTVSKAEGIKEFRIVPVELTEQNGYLSAKQSVKRHLIDRDFAELIDEIYAGQPVR
ncbi:AMP-dependent synthetase/ligase [Brevibacterium daeguense]|uniref:Acyl-CoA synthetase n=1 Tax=Brevibacterium daeguense TaxID=909936 RepID=A0ABP8EMX7_9MICO|nr:long-chain fatty acid--CoA ligase [Brevibacterium daeguense]